MPNLNKVFLIGHLTRDPETRAVGETSVTNFGIATNHKWQSKDGEKKEEVYFGECQCWGKRGEAIARFVKKGDALSVQGRLRLEQWDDKGGVKQTRTRIEVEDFQFLGGKRDGGDEQAAPQAKPRARTSGVNATTRPAAATSALDDDDIPF
jgi:single-strand DNA-binding protein